MSEFPKPLDVARVVPEAELVEAIRLFFALLRQDGTRGGITIGKPRRPRALIYVGSCPEGTDEILRALGKPYGYNVSPVRDPGQFAQYETATEADPKGY